MFNSRFKGSALQIAVFATGCAGIVAEFVLSTLATYLAGNAIFQWTIVMSLMLFAMGVGSRASRYFHTNLLDTFICIEFFLSILCSVSAVFAYSIAPWTDCIQLIIYSQAFLIGVLIGLEIPIVTRINDSYDELRLNISNVMEKDYFGSLIGGLVFAFFALPHLGLTYTPIILGTVNFLVAVFLLWRFFSLVHRKKIILSFLSFTSVFLVSLFLLAKPVILHGEQKKYKDKIIYSEQTKYQKIVMTQWKKDYWLYINGQEQFSTYDEELYHEPLVHPAMTLSGDCSNVMVLGGGDGLAVREVLKHRNVKSVTLIDLDPVMTDLSATHPVLLEINRGSFRDERVKIYNQDASVFLDGCLELFGVIIIDLPDPDTIDLMHVYSQSFYRKLKKHLIRGGVLVTQAASPYFARDAFLCIMKTINQSGFSVLPYHNQIPTMGEWGWVLGVRQEDLKERDLKSLMLKQNFNDLDTKFVNNDAVISMVHFGRGIIDPDVIDGIQINTEINPVLHRYYLSGSWGMY